MRWVVVVASFAALLAISSGSAAEFPSPRIADARKLYVTKCARCHELYDPQKYDKAEWDAWMLKMKKKSKLKDEQYEMLKSYTATLR